MADKRIIDMAELAEASSGWYAMLDSSADGTRKYDMGKVLAQAQGAAADAEQAATDAAAAKSAAAQATSDAAGAVSMAQAAASDAAAALTASSKAADDASAAAASAADAAEDAAKVDEYAEEVQRKANADGHATDLTAGFADNLAATGEPVSAEFISRASGGDGAARIASVKGNAVVWNQMVGESDTSVTVPSGHVYLSRIGGTAARETSTGAAIAVTGGTDNVFDLTLMFGQGNEPATVAEFEALYPASYYPYDAGTLLPVRVEGVETTDADDNPLFTREIPVATYFPDGMRSAGTVRDELTATAAVKRVGAVDLGTLTWGAEGAWQQSKGMTRFNAALPNAATAPITDVENVKASAYFTPNLTVTGSTMSTAYCIAQHANGRVYLTMPYPEFNRASDLTAWLQDHPVTLYYQIQPTTTEIDPPLNLDYKVNDFGTERIVTDSETVPPTAPVPLEIAYGIDAAATLASLPTDYISHESMAQFISAIEQHFGVTVTETWDAANGRYDYTIGA